MKMNTKEKILSTALALFANEGYENVGIQKIVSAVDVKKPTLYHHFGSKQGLLSEVLRAHYQPFLIQLGQSTIYQSDLTASLEQIMKCYFGFVLQQPELYRLGLALSYASENSEGRLTMAPFLEQQLTLLIDLFAAAEAEHGNMRGRSQRYGQSFLGQINAAITGYYYHQGALNDEAAFVVCKQFMHGIYS